MWWRLIKLSPVRERSFRNWNQRAVSLQYVLQRSVSRNKNSAVDLSERLDAFSPLPFDAAMHTQWIHGAH